MNKMSCSVCDARASLQCGACLGVAYCSRECAQDDWNLHQRTCLIEAPKRPAEDVPCRNEDDPFTMDPIPEGESVNIDGTCYHTPGIYHWCFNLNRRTNPYTNVDFTDDELEMIKTAAFEQFPLEVVIRIYERDNHPLTVTSLMSAKRLCATIIGRYTAGDNPLDTVLEIAKTAISLDLHFMISAPWRKNLFSLLVTPDDIIKDIMPAQQRILIAVVPSSQVTQLYGIAYWLREALLKAGKPIPDAISEAYERTRTTVISREREYFEHQVGKHMHEHWITRVRPEPVEGMISVRFYCAETYATRAFGAFDIEFQLTVKIHQLEATIRHRMQDYLIFPSRPFAYVLGQAQIEVHEPLSLDEIELHEHLSLGEIPGLSERTVFIQFTA